MCNFNVEISKGCGLNLGQDEARLQLEHLGHEPTFVQESMLYSHISLVFEV